MYIYMYISVLSSLILVFKSTFQIFEIHQDTESQDSPTKSRYSEAVDIYSAAMTLWFIFMGEKPFSNLDGYSVAVMASRQRYYTCV